MIGNMADLDNSLIGGSQQTNECSQKEDSNECEEGNSQLNESQLAYL
jgi:hypothetical protein